jgi:NDP-sugar pyrophosphorylase family protein
MKALILAGGRGRRLGKLTESRPKPLVEIAGKPILEHIILNSSAAGVNEFLMSIGYRGERIQEYFGDGSRWGVSIDYIVQQGKGPESAIFDARKHFVQEGRRAKHGLDALSYLGNELLCLCGDSILLPWQLELLLRLHHHGLVCATFITEKGGQDNMRRVRVGGYAIFGSSSNIDDPLLTYNMIAQVYFLDRLHTLLEGQEDRSFSLAMDDVAKGALLCTADIGDFININRPEDIANAERSLNAAPVPNKYILHVLESCPNSSRGNAAYFERMHHVVSKEKKSILAPVEVPDVGCACHYTDCDWRMLCKVVAVEPFTEERARKLGVNHG